MEIKLPHADIESFKGCTFSPKLDSDTICNVDAVIPLSFREYVLFIALSADLGD
jgi:hypothetical protein